jgi:hypothetical protein
VFSWSEGARAQLYFGEAATSYTGDAYCSRRSEILTTFLLLLPLRVPEAFTIRRYIPRIPLIVTLIDLVSTKRKMGWRNLYCIEHRDKDFNFKWWR